MIGEVGRRIQELRFLDGVEKVEHVPYPSGDEFWVRFNRPIDMHKLGEVLGRGRYELVKFGGIPSKLPSKLGELLWNGISYVIVKKIAFLGLLGSLFGFQPDGVATIARDAHSSQPIFITSNEEGVRILYDYLGIKYTAPQASGSATPSSAGTQALQKPVAPVARAPQTTQQPSASQPVQAQPRPRPTITPSSSAGSQKKPEIAPATANLAGEHQHEAWQPGTYRPHAWGKKVEGEPKSST